MADPEPPFEYLPTKYRDTPYVDLPPALKARVDKAVAAQQPAPTPEEIS